MGKNKVKVYLNENTQKLLILQAFKLYQMEAWTLDLFNKLGEDKGFKKLVKKVGEQPEVNSIQGLIETIQIIDVEFYHKVKGHDPVTFVGLVYGYLTGKELVKEAIKDSPIKKHTTALDGNKKKSTAKKKRATKDSNNNNGSS